MAQAASLAHMDVAHVGAPGLPLMPSFAQRWRSLRKDQRYWLMYVTASTLPPFVVSVVAIAASHWTECTLRIDLLLLFHAFGILISLPVRWHRYLYEQDPNRPGHLLPDRSWRSHLRNAFDVYEFAWFIAGNIIVFTETPTGCGSYAQDYRLTFIATMLALSIGYFEVGLMILIITCLYTCIPCFMWLTGVQLDDEDDEEFNARGADDILLKQIPVRRFHRVTESITRLPSSDNARLPIPATNPTLLQNKGTFSGAQIMKQSSVQSIYSIQTEDAQCSICLADYEEHDMLKRLPGCRHHFHTHCIDPWLKKNKTCPLCKQDVGQGLEKEMELRTREAHINLNK